MHAQVPNSIPGVPSHILDPAAAWPDANKFNAALLHLATLFAANFETYADGSQYVGAEMAARIRTGGPVRTRPVPWVDASAAACSACRARMTAARAEHAVGCTLLTQTAAGMWCGGEVMASLLHCQFVAKQSPDGCDSGV